MPHYIEDPYQRIVNVNWKNKRDDPNSPPYDVDGQTCGSFMNGIIHGIPASFSGVYVLSDWQMYMLDYDANPYRLPDKPVMYSPTLSDYVFLGVTLWWPYIWASAIRWTLTYGTYRNAPVYPGRIKEYRNVNPQVFNGTNVEPTRIYAGDATVTATILQYDPAFDTGLQYYYHPIIICERFLPEPYGWTRSRYPHLLVQAHCCLPGEKDCHEVHGPFFDGTEPDEGYVEALLAGLPPQPRGWGTAFDPTRTWEYPAQGSTNDPLTPPPLHPLARGPSASSAPNNRTKPGFGSLPLARPISAFSIPTPRRPLPPIPERRFKVE